MRRPSRHLTLTGMRIACLAIVGLAGSCGDSGGPGPEPTLDADVADADAATPGDADVAPDTPTTADGGDADAPDTTVGDARFTSTPQVLVQAGERWSYAPETDASEPVELRLTDAPDSATLADGVAEWITPTDDVFEASFVIDALVGDVTVASQAFVVSVNHAPAFGNAPSSGALVGEPYAYRPAAADPDDDPVTLRLVDGPPWAALDGDALVGTPDAAGVWATTLSLDDGRGGVADVVWEIVALEPLRDLRAEPGWIPSGGGDVSIFGCCFEGDVAVSVGATPAEETEVVNAARLRATFDIMPPGQQELLVHIDGELRGVVPTPLLVLPEARPLDDGDAIVVTPLVPAGTPVTVERFLDDPAGERPLRAGADQVTLSGHAIRTAPGPLAWAVAADDQRGFPTVDHGPVVVEVEPTVHRPGDTVSVRVAPPATGSITVRWGDRSATGELVDGRTSVRVPSGADGPVSFDAETPRLVAAQATAGPLPLVPELLWASRTLLTTGASNLVVVRGMGFDNPAATWDGVAAETVSASPDEALVALTPDEDGFAELTLRIGGAVSEPLSFVASRGPVTRGAERPPRADRPTGDDTVVRPAHGGVVEWDGALLAFGDAGLWARRAGGGEVFGLPIGDDVWTNLTLTDFPGGDAPIVDLTVGERGAFALLPGGVLAVLGLDGAWRRLSAAAGPNASVEGDEPVALHSRTLVGARTLAPTLDGLVAAGSFGGRYRVRLFDGDAFLGEDADVVRLDGGPRDAASAWIHGSASSAEVVSGDVTGAFRGEISLVEGVVPSAVVDSARISIGAVYLTRDGTIAVVDDRAAGPLGGPTIVLAESLGGGLRVESDGETAIVSGQGTLWRVSELELSAIATELPTGLPFRAGARRSAPHADPDRPWVVSDGVAASLRGLDGAIAADLCPGSDCFVDGWPVGDDDDGRILFVDLGDPAGLAYDVGADTWTRSALVHGPWGSADNALPAGTRHVGAVGDVALLTDGGTLWGLPLGGLERDVAGVRLSPGALAHLAGGGDGDGGPAADLDLGRIRHAAGTPGGDLWIVGERDGASPRQLAWRVSTDGDAASFVPDASAPIADCWPGSAGFASGSVIPIGPDRLLTTVANDGAWLLHRLGAGGEPERACRLALGGSGSLASEQRWGSAAFVRYASGGLTVDDPVAGTTTLVIAAESLR